jgi:hypothetical protein
LSFHAYRLSKSEQEELELALKLSTEVISNTSVSSAAMDDNESSSSQTTVSSHGETRFIVNILIKTNVRFDWCFSFFQVTDTTTSNSITMTKEIDQHDENLLPKSKRMKREEEEDDEEDADEVDKDDNDDVGEEKIFSLIS